MKYCHFDTMAWIIFTMLAVNDALLGGDKRRCLCTNSLQVRRRYWHVISESVEAENSDARNNSNTPVALLLLSRRFCCPSFLFLPPTSTCSPQGHGLCSKVSGIFIYTNNFVTVLYYYNILIYLLHIAIFIHIS